jgi:hypothetical protein
MKQNQHQTILISLITLALIGSCLTTSGCNKKQVEEGIPENAAEETKGLLDSAVKETKGAYDKTADAIKDATN